ncbi:MAG: ABC transporter ATP-binding protein [Eubacteriales bacterium]|nr:ABC transporter ATP-binding protein [Eubacteriales bacterium]
MTSSVLECRALTKYYGSTMALDSLDLTLEKGRIVGLLGPNGSGKTTLIKIAAGLLTPTSGTIRICGFAPSPESKALVSYLPEFTYFENHMRVRECFELFRDFYDDFDETKARDMIRDLGVSPEKRMRELSKGMKEKVQLVTVMSRRSRLFLLDEPIAGVDPASRDYILNTIIRNYSEDSTILISTHLISDVENVLDDYVFIRDGKVWQTGSVEALRENENKSVDALFREVFRYEVR